MTILYKKIDIYGHNERRTCVVCSACKQVFHPSQLPLGTVSTNGEGEEGWTCSSFCTFEFKRQKGAAARFVLLHKRVEERKKHADLENAQPPQPQPDFESIMAKYKSIPGATWADDE